MPHAQFTETFEQILKDTLPQTPGIQRSVALRELYLAAREFFAGSYTWTTIIENVDAPLGEVDIVVDDGNANTEVISILQVSVQKDQAGTILHPIGLRPARAEQSDSPREWFVTSNPDHIRVFPYLKEAQTDFLDITAALIPAFDATALPRQVTLKYYDALVTGYLARVYLHPNKPYSAPALAGQQRHIFLRQIGYHLAQRKQGFNNSQQWTFPRDFQVKRLGGNG